MSRLAPLEAAGRLDEALLLANDHALAKECVKLTRVVSINAEARRFFANEDGSPGPGTEPGAAIDPNFKKEGWPVFAKELLALVRGELPFQAELPLVLPHGGERTIVIRVSVASETKSSLSRVFVSFLDVTRQNWPTAELMNLDNLAKEKRAPREDIRSSFPILSKREAQVAAYLSDGLSAREIASTLALGVRTVETHIAHLYFKLDVLCKADAIRLIRSRLGR
jgi:DNA-binding CsgD family transcriptional regulator